MKKQTGFTLMEMMVVLAIAAVLITAGLPQLSIFFKGTRMVTNTNDLVAGLQISRSQAIKEGGFVTICKTDADTDPQKCVVGSGGWEKGWIVFVDTGGNVGVFEADDGPIVRLNTGASGTGVTITEDNTSIQDFITFTSRGLPKTGGASVSGVFSICDDRGVTNTSGNVVARGVELGASGRVRSTNVAAKITC